MSKIDLQYDLANLTPADALPVEANFNRIEQHINQELIERGGTVEMTAQLKLVGDPVNDLDASPKQYVDQVMPVGIVMMYSGAGIPPGGKWAICNGAELQTADYDALFKVMGYTYGGSGGRFNLPNLVSRFPMGTTLGKTGGTKDAVLVSHTHSISHNHGTVATGGASATHTHAISGTTSNANVNHSHAIPDGTVMLKAFGAQRLVTTGGTYAYDTVAHNTEGSAHTHTFSDTSSANNVGHTHNVDLPNFTGSTPALPGSVAGTDQNLPPYLGINFIIRVK